MHDEIKKQWVAALRSGEYEQTTGYLEVVTPTEDRAVGMCCLGVLCHLAEQAGVVTSEIVPGDTREGSPSHRMYRGADEFDYSGGTLPDTVANWAGLGGREDSDDPRVGTRTLAELNDDGASFEEIANTIEKSL